MKRLTAYLSVAILTFGIGVLARTVNPFRAPQHEPAEPLLVTISPTTGPANSPGSFENYIVTIKNVSGKTVRGYMLGFNCNCRIWTSDDKPSPLGTAYVSPSPDRQTLPPGESQEIPLPFEISSVPKPSVWVDLVHFENGANWGPNRLHKDGYVRD